MTKLLEKAFEEVSRLPAKEQDALAEQVLSAARSLVKATHQGTPGRALLRFAGTIEHDDLRIMRQAIEEGCEQVERW